MIAVHNFKHSEFRERVTGAILEMLLHLPEAQRNIFVWNHYCGRPPQQIAEIVQFSPSEVEAILDEINSILYQKTRSLLEEDPPHDSEMDLPATNFTNSLADCRFEHSPFDLLMEVNT